MTGKKFKVLRCDHCKTITHRRTSFKTVKCPKCKKQMVGEPIAGFDSVQDAIAFVKDFKIKNNAAQGDLFETFG